MLTCTTTYLDGHAVSADATKELPLQNHPRLGCLDNRTCYGL